MDERNEIELHVTPEDHDRALMDATRALVVQNARFGDRYDVVKRWRSPRFQKTVANIGAIVCGLAAILAGLSVAIEWTDAGEIPWLRVGMLLLFLVLFLVFQNTERLQTAGLQRINDALALRAHKMLEATGDRLPASVSYSVEDGEVVGTWTDDAAREIANWRHGITDETYILVGEKCLAGFDGPEKLSPTFFCYVDDENRTALLSELERAGASTEEIDESLLPEKVVQRPWPQG
ncbi:MAG: hypothetical protein ACQEVA_19820 [Myxococcota bacterium]